MSDELRFDLDLGTSKAEKSFRAFVNKAESSLKKLQRDAEKALGGGPKMSASVSRDEQRMARERENIRRHNQREQEKIDRFNERAAERVGRERMRAADRVADSERKAAESVAAFRIRQTGKIDNAELTSVQTRERLAQQLATDLVRVEQQRSSMTRGILAAELSVVAQANARRIQQAQTAAGAGGGPGGKFGRANQLMFGAQQVVEDFSFAGMKGVTNNLAAMSSTLGGPVGLAAMAGLTAVNLGMMYGAMRKGDSDVESAKARIDRLMDSQRELAQSRDAAFRDIAGRDPGDIAGSRRDTQREMAGVNREIEDEIRLRQQSLDISAKAAAARKVDRQISSLENDIDIVGRGNVGVPQRMFDELERLKRERSRLFDDVGQSLNAPVNDMEQMAAAEAKAREQADSSGASIEELRIELEKLGGIEQQARALEKFVNPLEKLSSFEMPNFGDFGDASGSRGLSDYADQFERGLKDAYENTIQARQESDDAAMQRLQGQYADALKSGDFDGASEALREQQELLQSQISDYEMLTAHSRELADAENERLTSIAQVQDLSRTVVDALDEQIAKTQQLIRAEDERVEKLRQARTESGERFGGDKFGARLQLLDKEAAAEKDALGNRYKGAELEQRLAAADKRRMAEERQLYDDRESQLRQRADSELKAAQEAQANGQSELAAGRFAKSRQTLEELQQLQLSQVGSRPLPEARDAFGRAEQTQGRIEGTFDAEMAAAEQAKAKEQAQLQTMQTALEVAKELKSEIESTPFISGADEAAVTRMRAEFQQILEIKRQIESTQAAAGDPLGMGGVPGRASGGPVVAGQPYMTGEFGRELFVPSSSGSILNASDTRGLMSQVAAAIAAGDHGGRQPVTAAGPTTNFGTVNVHTLGSASLDSLMAAAAMQAKNARLRRS